jgi:O-methyltransferase
MNPVDGFSSPATSEVSTEDAATANRPICARVKTFPAPETPAELYIDLLKRVLTRAVVAKPRERHRFTPTAPLRRVLISRLQHTLRSANLELVRLVRNGPEDYLESGHMAEGRVEDAETMLGLRQLDNMQACVVDVLRNNIPGDLVEAGVWRGGMTIFMRALLRAYEGQSHQDRLRQVWVLDSFEGLPDIDKSRESFDWKAGDMAVSLEEVKGNFARYGLLDDRVHFLKGFFDRTLPQAPISQIAILRIDADLYQSTLDVLNHLYPKLSAGGYAVFDDFQNLQDCRKAIEEYREQNGISEKIQFIDKRAVYWKKQASGA